MSGKAYSVLSAIYDRLTDKDLYEKWKDRSVEVLSSYPHLRSGIDAACGSGFFTIAQKKAGYDVIGVDICEEMLVEAQKNAFEEKLNVSFYRQDMTNLKVFKKYDYVTVVNDGLNYLDDASVLKAFRSFYNALNFGGVVYFDFSTPYRLKTVLGNNVFAEDYDDLTFLWFNEFSGDRIKMDMTVFKKEGKLYSREDESHVMYAHDREFFTEALKKAGFKKITACAFFGGEITPETERIEMIAEKL